MEGIIPAAGSSILSITKNLTTTQNSCPHPDNQQKKSKKTPSPAAGGCGPGQEAPPKHLPIANQTTSNRKPLR